MKKHSVILMVVAAIPLFFMGCVKEGGKSNDIVITNTVVVKDISHSKIIQEEARRTILEIISLDPDYAQYQVKKGADVKFEGIAAYRTKFNTHHIAFDFVSDLENADEVKICLYMVFVEEDGRYVTDLEKTAIAIGDVSEPHFEDDYYGKWRKEVIDLVNSN